MEADYYWIVLYAFTVLCIAVFYFLIWYLDLFHEERVEECSPPFGRLAIAYKYIRNHSELKSIRRSQRREPLLGLKTAVIYYGEDFKLQSATDQFKAYAIGVVLSENGTLPALPVVNYLTLHGYKVVVFPKITHAILATYKYKFNIDMDLCSCRVYKKFLSFMSNNEHSTWAPYKGTAWTVVASCTVLVISFDHPEGVMYNDTILSVMNYKLRSYRTSKNADRDSIYGIFNTLAARIERRLSGHPALEIYDFNTESLTFMLPLVHQYDFYVSEVIQDIVASN